MCCTFHRVGQKCFCFCFCLFVVVFVFVCLFIVGFCLFVVFVFVFVLFWGVILRVPARILGGGGGGRGGEKSFELRVPAYSALSLGRRVLN